MVSLKFDKLTKPKNAVILATIVFTFLCAVIIAAWRFNGNGYQVLPEGSYYGFLVAMAVCVLLFKVIIISVKVLDLEEKIPYFDVFNLFVSAAFVLIYGISCICGAYAASKAYMTTTLKAGVGFGWLGLLTLGVETVLCFLELRK